MHGKYYKPLSDQEKAQIKENGEKYIKLRNEILECYRSGNFIISNLTAVTNCLKLCPLDVTLWNYRAHIVQQNASQSLLDAELQIVSKILNINPKIYAMWEYQRFLITENMKFEEEKAVAQKAVAFLKMALRIDGRNYHAWNFAVWLQNIFENKINIEDIAEKLFAMDFSNFSALNFLARRLQQRPESLEKLKRKVQELLLIAPNDQALWTFYSNQIQSKDEAFLKKIAQSLDEFDQIGMVYCIKCFYTLKMDVELLQMKEKLNKLNVNSQIQNILQLLELQQNQIQ